MLDLSSRRGLELIQSRRNRNDGLRVAARSSRCIASSDSTGFLPESTMIDARGARVRSSSSDVSVGRVEVGGSHSSTYFSSLGKSV